MAAAPGDDSRADRVARDKSPKRGQSDGSESRSGTRKRAGAEGSGKTAAPASPPASAGREGQDGSAGALADGRSPTQLNDEGFRLMNAGRYNEAIPPLERAVAAFPQDSTDLTYAYALYNLGRSLRLAGRPDEAIPILERRLRFANQRATVQRELVAARGEARG
jgi:tetratricopeptide (TPR) repeat protein